MYNVRLFSHVGYQCDLLMNAVKIWILHLNAQPTDHLRNRC